MSKPYLQLVEEEILKTRELMQAHTQELFDYLAPKEFSFLMLESVLCNALTSVFKAHLEIISQECPDNAQDIIRQMYHFLGAICDGVVEGDNNVPQQKRGEA